MPYVSSAFDPSADNRDKYLYPGICSCHSQEFFLKVYGTLSYSQVLRCYQAGRKIVFLPVFVTFLVLFQQHPTLCPIFCTLCVVTYSRLISEDMLLQNYVYSFDLSAVLSSRENSSFNVFLKSNYIMFNNYLE